MSMKMQVPNKNFNKIEKKINTEINSVWALLKKQI